MSDSQEKPAPPTPAVRVADSDREAVAEQLRQAVTEGRLDLAELDERLNVAYGAKTRSDLEPLTADLPDVAEQRSVSEAPPLDLQTKSGTIKRGGYWLVPRTIAAQCTSGTVKLDFTEAECPYREVTIDAHAKSGSVVLVVPHGWSVNLDNATATSGDVVNKLQGPPGPGKPVLRVSGRVTSGTIKARHPRSGFWARLLRLPN